MEVNTQKLKDQMVAPQLEVQSIIDEMEIIKVNLWIIRRFRYNLGRFKEEMEIAHQLLVLTLQKVSVTSPNFLDYKGQQHSYKECPLSKWWNNQDITI